MKIFSAIARLIVGSLFIVSGLIKCNDAIGFSYKLNDYFAKDVLNLEFLIPYSLTLAVLICVVEVVLGVAVIFGLKSKLSSLLILLMMLFFTWLTWYTSSCLEDQAVAAKLGEEFSKNCVTDCGCFGDALKLEPKESFYKDLFLLIFTIPLFFFSFKKMVPKNTSKQDIFYIITSLILILGFGVFVIGWWFTLIFSIILYAIVYLIKNNTKSEWIPLIVAFVITLGFTWYCLQNLPIKDFRAYKVDSNITENMIVPEDAPKPVIDYHWKFKVDGEEKIITTNGSYPAVDGEFIGYDTEIIEEGYEPPILDFSIETPDADLTTQFLETDNLIIIASYNINKIAPKSIEVIREFTEKATKNGYTVIGLSSSSEEDKALFESNNKLNIPWLICDEKALKTVVRANPGILKMEKGTIKQKLHWKNIDAIKLEALPQPKTSLNLNLKRQLDSIQVLDQKYRGSGDNWDEQMKIDSSNTIFIENVFKEYGYPGKSLVGEPTNIAAWLVIQHSDKIEAYLPLIKEAGAKGELPMRDVAMMEDRFLMQNNKPQIYGTQGRMFNNMEIIWPIEDPENVNARRKEAGFMTTVEDYAKLLFGDEFKYEALTMDDVQINNN